MEYQRYFVIVEVNSAHLWNEKGKKEKKREKMIKIQNSNNAKAFVCQINPNQMNHIKRIK